MNELPPRPSFLRRTWIKLRAPLITFTLLYCFYVGAMYFGQRSLVFPGQYREKAARSAPGDVESLWIESGEAKCEVWYFAPNANIASSVEKLPEKCPLVIYTHGNGEFIDDWIHSLNQYRQWGCGVALVEYPNYGRSKGSPSEATITDVLCKTYDNLTARPEIDPDNVIMHGRSLGGGAICCLASQKPCAALILESTFTSVSSMALRMGLPGFLVRDPFNNLKVVSEWKKPLLIFHGNHDEVVPFDHGKKLAAAAPHATFVEWNKGHNDMPPNITLAWGDVRKFLDKAKVLPKLKKPKPKPKPKPSAKKPTAKPYTKKPAVKPKELAKPKQAEEKAKQPEKKTEESNENAKSVVEEQKQPNPKE